MMELGVHCGYKKNVFCFNTIKTRKQFFDKYWNSSVFLEHLLRFLIAKYIQLQQSSTYVSYVYRGPLTVDGQVIENLIPQEFGGLPEFIFHPNIQDTPDTDFINGCKVVTIGDTSYGRSKVVMIQTSLTKTEFFKTIDIHSVEFLQGLLTLFSKMEWLRESYNNVFVDLFPSHLVSNMMIPRKNPDDWYQDIYEQKYPSLEKQQKMVDDDKRKAKERAEEQKLRDEQEKKDAEQKKKKRQRKN